jgi:uncharacterized phiE125 gp8 family phage protein
MYSVQLDPVVSPVTPAELSSWLRLDDPADPALPILLESATQNAINFTGRSFIEQTVIVQYDGYPGVGTPTGGLDMLRPIPYEWIVLPYSPLVSVEEVSIVDEEGDSEIVDPEDYRVDIRGSRINFKGTFPAIDTKNFLVIEYKAGFGGACDVPAGIKIGIMKIAGWSYEHRGDCDPGSAPEAYRDLIPYRVMNRL